LHATAHRNLDGVERRRVVARLGRHVGARSVDEGRLVTTAIERHNARAPDVDLDAVETDKKAAAKS